MNPIICPNIFESVWDQAEPITIRRWLLPNGTAVSPGVAIIELETDKVRVEVPAMDEGYLIIAMPAGSSVRPGDVIGHIDSGESAANVWPPPPKENR